MVGLNQPVYSQVQGLQHRDQPAGQLDGYREVATANGAAGARVETMGGLRSLGNKHGGFDAIFFKTPFLISLTT